MGPSSTVALMVPRLSALMSARPSFSRALSSSSSRPSSSPSTPTSTTVRLAKCVAASGLCSRRQAEVWIADGRVVVNGDVVTNVATNVDPDVDTVRVDGERLRRERTRMFLVHKLPGELVTTSDPQGRPTLFQRIASMGIPDLPATLKAIGRLDFNSEGLLLLTTSGDVARHLEHPSSHWPRTYRVRVWGKRAGVTPRVLRALRAGVKHQGVRYRPMVVDVVSSGAAGDGGSNVWLEVTLTEGKKREVRRVLQVFGLFVNRLVRVAYGPYRLDRLPRGAVLETKLHPSIRSAVFGKPRRGNGGGGGRGGGGGGNNKNASGNKTSKSTPKSKRRVDVKVKNKKMKMKTKSPGNE